MADAELPEMLPGETRAEWAERIQEIVRAQKAAANPVEAVPFDPNEWDGVRKPYRESE